MKRKPPSKWHWTQWLVLFFALGLAIACILADILIMFHVEQIPLTNFNTNYMAANEFNRVGLSSPKNSRMNLDHNIHTTFDFMHLKPILVEEMLPSDTFDLELNSYVRVAPLASPLYGDIKVTTMAAFVPNRIIWDEWKNFLTGGSNGRLTRNVPSLNCYELSRWIDQHDKAFRHRCKNWLLDFGLPTTMLDVKSEDIFQISTLPFRAARRVWWDWLRDANLIGEDLEKTYCPTDSASHFSYSDTQTSNIVEPMNCPFEKDYFTTAFLEPQRGMDSFAPVEIASTTINPGMTSSVSTRDLCGRIDVSGGDVKAVAFGNESGQLDNPSTNNYIGQLKYNDLRIAHSIQHYLERNNIAGANALQQLLAHWGTAPNPATFNMSQFIGSSDDYLNCDEVTSLSSTEDAALGDTNTKFNGTIHFNCNYTANEHGYLVVYQMCRPVIGYYQGISRSWTRFDKFDYFTPELECTGFQPIYSRELYMRPNSGGFDDQVFGYAPRYSEYKFKNNRVSGDLANDTYDSYHLNRDLTYMFVNGHLDCISTAFTGARMPVDANGARFDRIFGDSNIDVDHFIQVCRVKLSASRPMRGFTIPVIDEIAGSDTTIPYAGVRI